MTKIAILTIATSKYIELFKDLKTSLSMFLPNIEKQIFLFTDFDYVEQGVTTVRINDLPWPLTTLLRFYYFNQIAEKLKDYDFIYYFDSDTVINTIIDQEVLPNADEIIAVKHPFFQNQIGPYEFFLKNSTAYIELENSIKLKGLYCQGCFFGSSAKSFLTMSSILSTNVNRDLKRNIIALVHDESHLNKFLLDNECKRLHIGYAYPSTPILNRNAPEKLQKNPQISKYCT